jgi:hypothetical protein
MFAELILAPNHTNHKNQTRPLTFWNWVMDSFGQELRRMIASRRCPKQTLAATYCIGYYTFSDVCWGRHEKKSTLAMMQLIDMRTPCEHLARDFVIALNMILLNRGF